MASSSSFGPAASVATRPPAENPGHHSNKAGTAIFSYTCVGLTGTTVLCVLFFFCHHIRNRAPVVTAAEEINGDRRPDRRSVDVAKLREFAYNSQSARRGGGGGDGDGDEGAAAAAQCSVCLGAVHGGEMVRRLPVCKHLYHVECIDMWLASHDTCPLCRSEVVVVVPPELPV